MESTEQFDMSYPGALRAAGIEVLAYEYFGSYQGDWLAKVRHEGQVGFIHDYYGSCSGCDALQGEIGYGYDEYDADTGKWIVTPEGREKLREFGQRYVDEIKTWGEVREEVSENLSWDMDAGEMVKWMDEHKES